MDSYDLQSRKPLRELLTETLKDCDASDITKRCCVNHNQKLSSFYKTMKRAKMEDDIQYFLELVSITQEEYQELFSQGPTGLELIIKLCIFQSNIHVHPDGTRTYILHDLCSKLLPDHITEDSPNNLSRQAVFIINLDSEEDVSLILMPDDQGLLPYQHLHPDLNPRFALMLTPKWSPTTHNLLPQSTKDTVLTLFTLMYITGTVWTLIPKEITALVISLTVDL